MSTDSDVESGLSAAEKRIAQMLTRLRRDNDLTLSELSEKTGLSESYLSRIENLKAAISIAKLAKLADAFVVPITMFFVDEGSETRCIFTPKGQGTKVRLRGRHGIDVRFVANSLRGRMMEPFFADVASAERGASMQSHEGDEFIYVISGKCRFFYGTEMIDMNAGDSIYFDSGTQHRVEPVDRRPCEILSIVTSRDFTFHGNMARLLNE